MLCKSVAMRWPVGLQHDTIGGNESARARIQEFARHESTAGDGELAGHRDAAEALRYLIATKAREVRQRKLSGV